MLSAADYDADLAELDQSGAAQPRRWAISSRHLHGALRAFRGPGMPSSRRASMPLHWLRSTISDVTPNFSVKACGPGSLTDLELAAYERALRPKRLVAFEGGHFDPYVARFRQASEAAVEWFKLHLG